MAQLSIGDEQGWITADVSTSGTALEAALEHPQAEAVIRCALLMSLCALVEGGAWPEVVLERMCNFMEIMSQALRASQLM
jgi:hypothetical protein